jgi:hypothetical protein
VWAWQGNLLAKALGSAIVFEKMKMSENQKTYEPLIIPIDKPFEKLSKKETKAYFDWFISHIDERSEYIRQKVSKSLNIAIESLDYSIESLLPIWRWFLQIAEVNKTPKDVLKQIKNELLQRGEQKEFIEDILRERATELSVFSRYVVRDIGMYVGKMFVTNYSALRWDYHTNTKRDSFANMPQIFGFVNTDYDPPFQFEFEPIHFTEMHAEKVTDDTQDENDLYNICKRWSKWIPEE